MLTKSDLSQIQGIIRSETTTIVDNALKPVKKDIKQIKTRVGRIEKTVDVMAKLLDKEQMDQRKRLKRLEDHVGLNPQ